MDVFFAELEKQLASLNWLLILGAIGFTATVKKAVKAKTQRFHYFVIAVGIICGLSQLVHMSFDLVWYRNLMLGFQTSFTYAGMIGFVYIFVKPVEVLSERIKIKGSA